MIPVMLNFETSNGIKMPKLNFDFKQRKYFPFFMAAENFSLQILYFVIIFLSKQFISLVQSWIEIKLYKLTQTKFFNHALKNNSLVGELKLRATTLTLQRKHEISIFRSITVHFNSLNNIYVGAILNREQILIKLIIISVKMLMKNRRNFKTFFTVQEAQPANRPMARSRACEYATAT